MKKRLNNYYGIDINEYKDYNDGIIFFIGGDYYYFTKSLYDEDYINALFNICSELKNVKLHSFVLNKENKLISDGYILFKLNTLIDDITIQDIYNFIKVDCSKYKKDYIYMDKFWEDKIDYLEIQLTELSNNKLINNSFDYFVGLAEILILYLKNNFNKEDIKLCLSHKCFNSLNTIDFYNPLNISFDIYIKDIASYIRITKDRELLLNIIDKESRNLNYLKYFFVRMVFPFNYFYEISNVLIDGKANEELVRIVNNVYEYECYMYEMEKLFGIYIFSWIKKE